MVKVLFEVWLNSRVSSEEMWNTLQGLVANWRHRLPTIQQWNATLSSLSARIIRLMYGSSYGTEWVVFKAVQVGSSSLGSSFYIDLDPSYLFYSWYRVLNLLGNFEPPSIHNPENYFEAIKGLGISIQTFLRINFQLNPGTSSGSSLASSSSSSSSSQPNQGSGIVANSNIDLQSMLPRSPDGNSILTLFGGWLLEAINNYPKGFDRGKEEALDLLCTLFSTKRDTSFIHTYVASFYSGLYQAFNTRTNLLLAVILRKSTQLFQAQLPGSSVLIPGFLLSIERILFDDNEIAIDGTLRNTSTPIVTIRRAIGKIISSLICLPNHFKQQKLYSILEIPTPEVTKALFLPPIINFLNVNPHLAAILIRCLKVETDTENRLQCLWNSNVFLYENIGKGDPIPNNFLSELVDIILEKLEKDSWNYQSLMVGISVLANIATIYSRTDKKLKHLLSSRITSTCCKYIRSKLESEDQSSGEFDDLIAASFDCILRWVMAGQWITKKPKDLFLVLEVAELGIYGKPPEVIERPTFDKRKGTIIGKEIKSGIEPSDKIKQIAEILLIYLVNFQGQFPPPTGPVSSSSLQIEADLQRKQGLPPTSLSTFIFTQNFITVLRLPRKNGNSSKEKDHLPFTVCHLY